MYGGYTSSDNSLFDFRLLEWRKAIADQSAASRLLRRGGNVAWVGAGDGPSPTSRGSPFQSGLLIDHATVTLHWAGYEEFEAACRH